MSSSEIPSPLVITEREDEEVSISDPDVVAEQLRRAAFVPRENEPTTLEKRRRTQDSALGPVVARAEIDPESSTLNVYAQDQIGITQLTPKSHLKIEPKITWDQVFIIFLEVHRYDRTLDYHGIPIEKFLSDGLGIEKIFIIIAGNYIQSLDSVFRGGVIRSFETKRKNQIDGHGRVDIAKSLWNFKRGIPKQHFITREPEYNIPVNNLIYTAGEYLLALFRSRLGDNTHQGYYSIFSDLKQTTEKLENLGIYSNDTPIAEYKQITAGALPPQRAYYRRAIELSKSIISSAIGRPLSGGNEQLTVDYLIDMDSLFQEYSQIVLERHCKSLASSSSSDVVKLSVEDEPTYSPFQGINTRIQPDHLLFEDDHIASVLDSKYYRKNSNPILSTQNRRQIYEYTSVLDVYEVALLCPFVEGQTDEIKKYVIEPSNRRVSIVSCPEEFTTEGYESAIQSYLSDLLDIPTTQSDLYSKIETGRICGSQLSDSPANEVISQKEFTEPITSPVLRDIQSDFAKYSNRQSDYAIVKRNSNELSNEFYRELKQKVAESPEWSNVVLPIYDEDDRAIELNYIEFSEQSINRVETIQLSPPTEWR